MKKAKKVILIVLAVIVVMFGGMMLVLNRGMGEIKSMIINNIDLQGIEDGYYEGVFTGGRWSNKVAVTVVNHSITHIQVIDSEQLKLMNSAAEAVKKEQSLQIDTVSGATVTTKAFLKAVENALAEPIR